MIHLCRCGCGEPTKEILENDASKGWVKGEYHQYIGYHPRYQGRTFKHGHTSKRNGPSLTYVCWVLIIERCETGTASVYSRYGGRGIRMCKRWRESFLAFLEDMGERPSKDYSIHRIDNSGNYEPGNCRWLLKSEHSKISQPIKTHCPKGHPYNEQNTRVHNGKRYCRECGRLRDRLRRSKSTAYLKGE
jgi:hypothetical protein